MKTVVLFTRRNVGMYCLSHLVALGYRVKVVSDDIFVSWLAGEYGCEFVTQETMGDFDLVLSVHWHRIIPVELFNGKPAVNVHPCLKWYRGADPIKKYISNMNTVGSVAAHHMTDIVDDGELICEVEFETGVVKTYAEFYNTALPIYYEVLSEVLKKVF